MDCPPPETVLLEVKNSTGEVVARKKGTVAYKCTVADESFKVIVQEKSAVPEKDEQQ